MKRFLLYILFLLPFISAAQIPTAGLVGYYPLNGNANDSSGNGYNGTIVGPTPDTGVCHTPGYYFHNDYIDCGSPASGVYDLLGDATVSFWFMLRDNPSNSNAGYFTLIGKDISGGSVNKWFIFVYNDSIGFHINGPAYGNGFWRNSNAFTFSQNVFYFVAVTKSGNNYTFYINDVAWGTVTFPINIPGNSVGMQIGQNEQINTNVVMDQVLIYNRALGQLGVDSIYNACNIIPNVTAGFNTMDTLICPGTCIPFTNTSLNAASYQWSFPGSATPSSTDTTPTHICYATPGIYDVQLIAGNSSSADTLTLHNYIHVLPAPNAGVVTVNPSSVCSGSGSTVTDSGFVNKIQWQSSADGITFANIPGATSASFVDSPLTKTTYYRTLDDNGICGPDTSAAQVVTVLASGNAGTIVPLHDTICQGTTDLMALLNSSGSPIEWQVSTDSIHFTNFNPVNDSSFRTNPILQTTYFRVQTGSGNCLSVSPVVRVYVPPTLTAFFNYTSSGNTVSFNSSGSSGNIIQFVWDFDDNTSSSDANPVHTFTKDTTYNVCLSIYDGSNCSYTFCRNVSIATGVSNMSIGYEFDIYPIPFDNILFIRNNISNISTMQIRLVDMLRRVVYYSTPAETNHELISINTSALPKGIYMLEMQAGNSFFVQRVVKQ